MTIVGPLRCSRRCVMLWARICVTGHLDRARPLEGGDPASRNEERKTAFAVLEAAIAPRVERRAVVVAKKVAGKPQRPKDDPLHR